MRIAGIVLDIYDDPKGLVLRNKVAASGKPLPEKLASARLLAVEELDQLPHRVFAMVATNDGETVRKYAMHDQAHLVTSLIYFAECGHLLPDDVQAKVAMNLVNGCSWYGMDPPDLVVKRAMLGGVLAGLTAGMGVMDMAQKAREGTERGRQNMDMFRAAQASGTKVSAGRTIDLSLAEDRAMQAGDMPDAGHIFGPLSEFSKHDETHKKLDAQLAKRDQPEPSIGGYPGRSAAGAARPVHKTADLNGTDVMPMGTLRSGAPSRGSERPKVDLPSKTAAGKLAAMRIPQGWWDCGDITSAERPVTRKTASHDHFALPHLRRYPIDTAELVKKAAAYFDEHIFEFPHEDRRIFAQSVFSRSEELGIKVAGDILVYAGDHYGPHIDGELHARISRFDGTGHEAVYELLLEKRADIDPMIMADMLRKADEKTGAAKAYGRLGTGFRDPYAAVYGGPKLAEAQPKEEDTYSWNMGTDYCNGIQLTALSKRGLKLNELFGDGFADAFQKDPIGQFKSMPDPQKVVLSRLAADNSGATNRI